jgi:hypothetical protein
VKGVLGWVVEDWVEVGCLQTGCQEGVRGMLGWVVVQGPGLGWVVEG